MYYLLIIAGGLMTMDTIWLSTVCNGNLGTALPAIMGVPLLLIGLFKRFFMPWFRTPAGHIAKVLLIACYSAAVVFFCCMGAMLSSAAHRKADYGKDVLIVLGCAVRGERVSLTLKLRLDAALEYLEHSPNTAVIVSGGKGDGENISEAEAMKRYLVSHGIDEGRMNQVKIGPGIILADGVLQPLVFLLYIHGCSPHFPLIYPCRAAQ